MLTWQVIDRCTPLLETPRQSSIPNLKVQP
jgi:hypothetical protein